MNLSQFKGLSRATLLGAALMVTGLTGCQTWIAGQTLPSPNYLEDDVQFFPAGPEFPLTRQVQAIEEYELQNEAINSGLRGDLGP